MRDDGGPNTVQSRPPFDSSWNTDMFHFFCHMFYRDHAFEDMYCFCLRLLDRMVVTMDASYAEFNMVMAALRSRLVEALAQRPLSFRELKRMVSISTRDCESSVHSCSESDGLGFGVCSTSPAAHVDSQRYTSSSSSSADDSIEVVEKEEEQLLAKSVADAMAAIPCAFHTIKCRLQETATGDQHG